MWNTVKKERGEERNIKSAVRSALFPFRALNAGKGETRVKLVHFSPPKKTKTRDFREGASSSCPFPNENREEEKGGAFRFPRPNQLSVRCEKKGRGEGGGNTTAVSF